jgi:glycolate oxidase
MRDHFERILGRGNATDAAIDLLAYSTDGSEQEGKARVVLFPTQDEQLRLILSYANRSTIDVIPRGLGAGMNGGAIPDNSIVVSMLGFERIHAINIREQWVNVDAGVTIAQLNEALVEHGVRYPLEPFAAATTTIGGFLAENGTSRHGLVYGNAKDTVLELEIMDGTGKFVATKNDIEDVIGSEGTLAIIVRAKLKIIPIRERSADYVFFDTLSQAIQRSFELSEAQRKPIAIDYLDPAVATYTGINTKHTLLIEYEDDKGSLRHEEYAKAIAKRARVRRRLGEQGYVRFEDSIVEPALREQAIRWCNERSLPVVAHLGQGIIHPFFKREQEAAMQEWWEYLTQHGASVVGQCGYGRRKRAYVPESERTRWRQAKERLDYNDILGRGKRYDFI